LNLIRVMPAKGQDMAAIASPRISLFLARLIGPVVLAVAIGVLANGAIYRGLSEEFARSAALIYITGILGMSVGVSSPSSAGSPRSAAPSASSGRRPRRPPSAGSSSTRRASSSPASSGW
jgi:hypothetical protein